MILKQNHEEKMLHMHSLLLLSVGELPVQRNWPINGHHSFMNIYDMQNQVVPERIAFSGKVACPRKLGSPNTSSSCTTNLMNASSGFRISNSHLSPTSATPNIGLKPFSAETIEREKQSSRHH